LTGILSIKKVPDEAELARATSWNEAMPRHRTAMGRMRTGASGQERLQVPSAAPFGSAEIEVLSRSEPTEAAEPSRSAEVAASSRWGSTETAEPSKSAEVAVKASEKSAVLKSKPESAAEAS